MRIGRLKCLALNGVVIIVLTIDQEVIGTRSTAVYREVNTVADTTVALICNARFGENKFDRVQRSERDLRDFGCTDGSGYRAGLGFDVIVRRFYGNDLGSSANFELEIHGSNDRPCNLKVVEVQSLVTLVFHIDDVGARLDSLNPVGAASPRGNRTGCAIIFTLGNDIRTRDDRAGRVRDCAGDGALAALRKTKTGKEY